MTCWQRLRYANGMHHVVSDDLLPAVQEAMRRAVPPGVLEETEGIRIVDTICLELGGPCNTDRPYEEVMFRDLTIRIPSEDLLLLLDAWKISLLVSSLEQKFYRLAGWPWQCLVVAAGERAGLLDLLGRCVERAEQRAQSFWASRQSPQEVLRAYHETMGLVMPYGPDKIVRFR